MSRTPRIRVDAAHLGALLDDLDASVREFLGIFEAHPDLWAQGRPGKWTVGHHAAHVAITCTLLADPLEAAADALRAGTLERRPPLKPLQRVFIHLVLVRGWMPRGAKTIALAEPPAAPERVATLASLRSGAARVRGVASTLGESERERVWFPNPFRHGWHYSLAEVARIQAVHTRHHGAIVGELVTAVVAVPPTAGTPVPGTR